MAQKTTPMMEQYNEIKSQYPNTILFFRLGDFYEMFNEDALEASKVLEITLTSRNKNSEDPIPMCGVPFHSANQYIRKLVSAGYKVAICEQLEDPKLTKGMVERGVVKVITPGTIMEEGSLSEKENNFLASLYFDNDKYYFTYVDVSTGEIYLSSTDSREQLTSEIQSVKPSEFVVSKDHRNLVEELISGFEITISEYEFYQNNNSVWFLPDANESETYLLDFIFSYIFSVQKQVLTYIKPVERYEFNDYLQMNYFAKNQLELTKSLRTQRKNGSLLWYLDQTKTAMGGRLLHQWLEKPLFNKSKLLKRHSKVELLSIGYFERMELVPKLRDIYDIERLIAKIGLNSANARDIDQLRYSLLQIPTINQLLSQLNLIHDNKSFEKLNEFSDILKEIQQVLKDDPSISITDGNIINDNYHSQLDEYRDALNNGEKWLADLQLKERERTGLKTLKIGFNKVFGYYIEISRLQAQNLDDDRYQRKQTLANAERYFTEELKDIEQLILNAKEKSKQLEYEIFVKLRNDIQSYIPDLQILANQIAELDVLCNFAMISEKEDFVKANISDDAYDFELKDNRHPVVEHLIGKSNFVSNNVDISAQKHILLLTGPNMSGKSTYMRQIAYSVILNQIGCFVPASYAKLPLVDKIFTRIGSSDDISQGQSTFMVEMMETNYALRNATSKSLLLFDELGRGTSTYDGIALAQGILEYISKQIKSVTVFSTHYHELTSLENQLDELVNIHVGSKEDSDKLVFLHQIFEGPADKSYGIHVAKLAGMPINLIKRSQHVLEDLENHSKRVFTQKVMETTKVMSENPANFEDIISKLEETNINQLTPIDALNLINELKHDISREKGEILE